MGFIQPIDGDDFDETLSNILQLGSLLQYQQEFEKRGNHVQSSTQKALVGTFMGGLKLEIAKGIQMLKPRILKEEIRLAQMQDEQLLRQQSFTWPLSTNGSQLTLPTPLEEAHVG
ncbi:uncharacterized protein LOC112097307, partial [Olea europaea subsp. europaea]